MVSSGDPKSSRNQLGHLVPLSHVTPEPLRWLSPGRVAAGKITILDGDPGLGKSTLLCEFAARLSRGDPLPGGEPGQPSTVILMSAEDDLHDTIRPRIDAAGGDARRIISFANVPHPTAVGKLVMIPDHVDVLAEIIGRTGAALLIVDPLFAFLSSRLNANSDQAIRRALAALKGVAERTGAAIVAVRHLNKSMASNPLYRGGGSIGIIGAARCGLLLAQDPDDPERRILAATKGNLDRLPPSLAFRLVTVPGSDIARVAWEEECDWTAARLLRESGTEVETRLLLTEAREWLRASLASGPRAGKELVREAHEAGFGRNLLYAARKVEGVQIHKERVAGGRWLWSGADVAGERPSPPVSPEVREVR